MSLMDRLTRKNPTTTRGSTHNSLALEMSPMSRYKQRKKEKESARRILNSIGTSLKSRTTVLANSINRANSLRDKTAG